MPRAIDWMKTAIEYVAKTKHFEQHMKNIKVLSMSNGECKSEFVVSKSHLNSEGHLSGGLTTTLVDVLSSWALCTHGNGMAGVSTNIHISSFQKAFPGDVLSINAKVYRVQSPLVFVEVELAKKNSGDIVTRGQHTLFLKPLIYPSELMKVE